MRRRRAVLAESLPLFGLALVILGPTAHCRDIALGGHGNVTYRGCPRFVPTGQQALWTATALATLAAVGTIVLGVPVALRWPRHLTRGGGGFVPSSRCRSCARPSWPRLDFWR